MPAVVGVVFLTAFLAKLPSFVTHVYWDSDVASAATLAQALGHGTVTFQRFPYYLFFALAVLTRSLPLHRQLWEGGPYFLALASVAMLAFVTLRLAGRWAAAMTATIGVATSPLVSYDRVTLNFHTPTFFAVPILALYCFWSATERRPRIAVAAALGVGLIAGVTLTDGLFAFVGVFPLAFAGLLLAARGVSRQLRVQGLLATCAACAAFPFALLTDRLAGAEHAYVFPAVPLQFAAADELWDDAGRLLYNIVRLANGDYFLGSRLDARSALSFACAVAIVLALAAPFALLRRQLRSGSLRLEIVVVSAFWSACIVGNCLGFALCPAPFYLVQSLCGSRGL